VNVFVRHKLSCDFEFCPDTFIGEKESTTIKVDVARIRVLFAVTFRKITAYA